MDGTAAPRTSPGKLRTRVQIFYGSGQGVDAVVQAAINTFMLFYLTAVCGMSGSSAGLVFFLSLAVDGLLDPYIGRLSDLSRSRWGRRLPFMAAALPPIALSIAAIFSIPSSLTGGLLFAYVLGFNIVLRVSVSVFALPHSALTAELTGDYAERSRISAFRALFVVVGTAVCVAPALGVIFGGEGGLQTRSAYPALGAWTAAAALLFGGLCILGSAGTVLRLADPQEPDGESGAGFLHDVRQLFRNPSFAPLFLGAVLVLIGGGVATSINLHVYRFFWQLPASQIQLPLIVAPIGMILAIPAASLLLKRFEKRDGVSIAVASIAISQSILPILSLLGILEPGSVAALSALIINGIIFGAGSIVCFICFYSMMADAVDDHDRLFGVRREALYSASLLLGSKAATGLGALIAGVSLQLIGVSREVIPSGAATLPASTGNNLGLLWGPGVGALLLASLPFFRRYGIDRKHHEKVLAILAARHADVEYPFPLEPAK